MTNLIRMTAKKKDVIAHFGGITQTAAAYGVTKGAVSQWPELIPEKRALQLPAITNNTLLPVPLEQIQREGIAYETTKIPEG